MNLRYAHRFKWSVALAVLMGSCAAGEAGEQSATNDLSCVLGRIEPGEELGGLIPAVDLDDRENVVEVHLVAEPATKRYTEEGVADVFAYRDAARPGAVATVPGPLIEAKQGDRVVVRLRNDLPDATTIHWHGVRVPNSADGTPSSQREVPPGGEFTYDFVVRDAGTFWYHPHVHGDHQIERGLQGMLVVHGAPNIPDVDVERNLVLDDVKLDAAGRLATDTTSDDVMLGRVGNLLLVNGKRGGKARATSGSRERWRIVNTANGRYFKLRLPGHVLTVIGWDGGLLERPYETETLLVTPGERYEVLVHPRGEIGAEIPLEALHYDRGHGSVDPGPQQLFELVVASEAPTPPAKLPAVLGPPVALAPPTPVVQRAFVLNELSQPNGDVLFTINGASAPALPVLSVREGETETWLFQNDSEMDHPMHVHGLFFRVLDLNGTAPAHVGWKDTVNVPAKSRLRVLLQYDAVGRWLYHCHILEHAERGMTGELRVVGRGEPLPETERWPTEAPPAAVPPAAPSAGGHAGHGAMPPPPAPATGIRPRSGDAGVAVDAAVAAPAPATQAGVGGHAGH